jgi:hypothetical protein
MNLIRFSDTCEILRPTGSKDAWDNPEYDTVYSGECLYEEGGSYYSSQIFVKSPNVFIPKIDDLVLIGDVVEITTEKGRVVRGVARGIRDINMSVFAKQELTRIELDQANEKE